MYINRSEIENLLDIQEQIENTSDPYEIRLTTACSDAKQS